MNCKNHNDREATIICSVCGENFCQECIDLDSKQCRECKSKSDISQDILNDILSNVEIPDQKISTFDPTDILKQIEDEIALQHEFEKLDFEINNEISSSNSIEKLDFTSEGITTDEQKNDVDLNLLVEGVIQEEPIIENHQEVTRVETPEVTIIEELVPEVKVTTAQIESVDVVTSTVEEVSEITDSSIDKIMHKVILTKDTVVEKASNFDTEAAKDSVKNAANATKAQASKLKAEAKIKTASAAAGAATAAAITKEKAVEAKIIAKQKMDGSKKEMDSILNKIKEENANGEYDHLLGKFTTTYGQHKETVGDGDEHSALPLRINSIIYFIASLIPGAAQLYLGLTARGITILLIGAFFFFITNTASLFFITAMLSFADAYKLRNIYHRGGKIEDTNNDVLKLIKNPLIILMIIAAIIIDIM